MTAKEAYQTGEKLYQVQNGIVHNIEVIETRTLTCGPIYTFRLAGLFSPIISEVLTQDELQQKYPEHTL